MSSITQLDVNGIQMEISRSLITFAYVAEQFEKTGDIGQGLLPLFAPVVAKRTGARFSAAQFAEDVLEMYDIEMHPYVAKEFAPRLAAAGYLKKIVKRDSNVLYENQQVDIVEPPLSEERLYADGMVRLDVCLERRQLLQKTQQLPRNPR